jgi:hypothetical protein
MIEWLGARLATALRCTGLGHTVDIGKSEADIITCRNWVKVLDVDRGSLDKMPGEGGKDKR